MNKNRMILPALWLHILTFVLTIIGMAIEAEWYFILLGLTYFASIIITTVALFKEY